MKKITTLVLALVTAGAGFSQTQVQEKTMPNPALFKGEKNNLSAKDLTRTNQNNNKATQSYWVDYVTHYQNLYGSTSAGLFTNNLFPDSTLLADYGTSGFASTWIHRVGQVFDLSATAIIADGISISKSSSFTIDSLAAAVIYTRVDNSVTDTLRFQIVAPTTNQMGGRTYFYNDAVSANLNPGDTVFMIPMDWMQASLSTPDVIAEYKIPLDGAFYADSTANGIHFPSIQTNATIPVQANAIFGNKFGVIMDFIPGYTWTPNGDTINFNKNGIRFASWELEGTDTYPFYDKNDYNHFAMIPQDVRYNNAGGWNDTYIPSYAYMGAGGNTFNYEALAVQAFVTGDDGVGVEELSNDVNFNVYPNPSTGDFKINFGATTPDNINLVVRDIVGKTIINKTVSNQTKSTISLAGFSKGVYFLTVGNTTEKLIVE